MVYLRLSFIRIIKNRKVSPTTTTTSFYLFCISHESEGCGWRVASNERWSDVSYRYWVLDRHSRMPHTHTHAGEEGTNTERIYQRTNIPTNKRKLYGSLKVLVPYICKVLRVVVWAFLYNLLITYFITVVVSSGSFLFLVLLHFHIYLIFLGLDLIF